MANNVAAISNLQTISAGDRLMVMGTITLAVLTHTYNGLSDTTLGAGGMPISSGTATISTGDALRRTLSFNVQIDTILSLTPLRSAPTPGAGAQAACYLWEMRSAATWAKVQLFAGAAAAEGPHQEPEGSALTDGTYTANFLAIGK